MSHGSSCSTIGCTNSSTRTPNKMFHGYPVKDPKRLAAWIGATKRENFIPKPSTKICSDHFIASDYAGPHSSRLMAHAIPSVFTFPPILQSKKLPPRPSRKRKQSCKSIEPSSCKEPHQKQEPSTVKSFKEHSYSANKEESMKRLESINHTLTKKVKVLNKTVKRQKEQILKLKKQIAEQKGKMLLGADL